MQERVKAPAIALIVLGSLGVLQALGVLALALLLGNVSNLPGMEGNVDAAELEKMGPVIMVVYGAVGVYLLAVAGFVIFAGTRMLKLKSWPIALVASIMVMIPCFSLYTCPLGLGVGIWALIVLSNDEVKAAFRQNATPG